MVGCMDGWLVGVACLRCERGLLLNLCFDFKCSTKYLPEMERRGSESFPIDLTEDEPPSKKFKSSVKSKEFRKIMKRLNHVDSTLKSFTSINDSDIVSRENRMEVDKISDKCQSIETRLEIIEKRLGIISQAFAHGMVCRVSHEDGYANTSHLADVPAASDLSELENGHQQNQISSDIGDAGMNGIISQHLPELIENPHLQIEENISRTNNVDQIRMSSKVTVENGCEVVIFDSLSDTDVDSSNVKSKGKGSGENERDISMLEELESEDVKPRWIKLQKLQCIKEELVLNRDDQGRVLVFLQSEARRLNKNSSRTIGLAGTYFKEDLHNEFIFESEHSMRDVKMEAEIRAALYGLEVIKSLFYDCLDSVCVMIISSSNYLVQQMKTKRIYPNSYTCTCEHHDCEHSETRWATSESLGKSQINILPKLTLLLKVLRVHWSKIDNQDIKEKQIAATYKADVDVALNDHVHQLKKTTCSATETYPALLE